MFYWENEKIHELFLLEKETAKVWIHFSQGLHQLAHHKTGECILSAVNVESWLVRGFQQGEPKHGPSLNIVKMMYIDVKTVKHYFLADTQPAVLCLSSSVHLIRDNTYPNYLNHVTVFWPVFFLCLHILSCGITKKGWSKKCHRMHHIITSFLHIPDQVIYVCSIMKW